MNNQQFRRLVLDTPTTTPEKDSIGATPRRDGAMSATLGSRMRSSIPMTPRSVTGSAGIDFARQLREQNAPTTNTKKFRSSAAPKGTKLASGYQDRTQLRTSVEEDAKAARIKALEDMVKLGQMDQATFEALRDEIVGGDVRDVHLVKGLDWKLLERVKRGEDVLAEKPPEEDSIEEGIEGENDVDVDDALEDLEEREVQPLVKEERVKKGEMAPPSASLAGKKRTRDDILRELKESRRKAAEDKKANQPALGPKFKKLGAKQEKSRIEKDDRGREVLITVDEEGNVKRKVKKVKVMEEPVKGANGLLMPDKDAKPLGMEVPEIRMPELPVEEDLDIFEGVGNDYDPLGGADDDEDDDTDDDLDDKDTPKPLTHAQDISEPPSSFDDTAEALPTTAIRTSPAAMPPPSIPQQPPQASRNYFNTTPSLDPLPPTTNPLTDPTILAALKKASTISPLPTSTAASTASTASEAAKLARRQQMLASHDRDADDMDLGFGSSRLEDDEDGEERKVKLSVWGKDDADDGKGEGRKGPRKRGGKKRKGDKESVADVLGVVERQRRERG